MNDLPRTRGRPRRPVTVSIPVRVPLALVDRIDALSDALDEPRAATIRRVLGWLPPVEQEQAA